MSQTEVFTLPDVGEGLTEAEIVRWHVQPGDTVTINQTIVEIETAKAVVELPCPYAGVVAELHADAGVVLAVGSPLISVEVKASTREPVLVGYGVKNDAPGRRRRRDAEDSAPSTVSGSVSRPRAKPIVRKLARDLGVDLATIIGTGPDGDVTRDDVLKAGKVERPAAEVRQGDELIPVRGVQRAMADAMVESYFTAPHVTIWVDVDMTRTLDLVQRLRGHGRYTDAKVTALTIMAAAIAATAKQYPRINASWVDTDHGADVLVYKDLHLGIAADTPRGLLVPVLKNAGAMTLPELARGITELVDTARQGKSTPADLTGGTISVTNIGVFGIDGGTPILSPGQTSIFAMGRIIDKPWVVDGVVTVRPVMQVNMSFDHRVLDGASGSRALQAIAAFLTDPAVGLVLNG
jgi:2-oxoisovalerate dehydrogenase E2 component (dihydrolipoyl transacylase)